MKTAGTVYWITGLSGAGKTTLGSLLYKHLQERQNNLVFLDGDNLREVFGNDLGHTQEERLKSAMRNARICKLLSDQGIDVICATISLFHECQNWNRKNMQNYIEIFLDTPMHTLIQRDSKGLFKSGSDNIVGLHIPEEFPKSPNLTLDGSGKLSPEELLQELLNYLNSAQEVKTHH